MTRGPAWLFVAGLGVFALLGLLAGSPQRREPSEPLGTRDPVPRVAERRPEPVHLAPMSTATQSPEALARAFGAASANWSDRSTAEQLRGLARLAVPPLAAELRDAAATTRSRERASPEMLASRGSVVGTEIRRSGRGRQVIVVTRETTSHSTPAAARYHVYTGVALRRGAHGWRMAQWQRQP
jgi:hypothetical protein